MEETYTYTLQDEDVNREIILKWILTVNWICVAQYSDKTRAVVNTAVIIMRVPQNSGNFLTARGNMRFSRSPLHAVEVTRTKVQWTCACETPCVDYSVAPVSTTVPVATVP
jgi:hypothetical protein